MLWWVISQAYDYIKTFYLLYTSFMLNNKSTNSVVLKAKLQQQMYT